MRTTQLYAACFVFLSLFSFSSCMENDLTEEGEGALKLNVNMKNEVVTVTRATSDDQNLKEKAVVKIYSEKGLIRKYEGVGSIPEVMQLKTGTYRMTLVSGDSVPASFDKVFYKGDALCDVETGKTTPVELIGKIANTLATVNFGNLESVFSAYSVKVFLPTDTLTFTKENVDQTGYFMMPETETSLGWLFEGVQNNGKGYQQSGIIAAVKPTTRYALNFNFKELDAVQGGALIDIKVDETEILFEEEVVIYKRPDISGEEFNLDQPLFFELSKGAEVGVWIAASSELKSVVLSSDHFSKVGIVESSVDFLNISESAWPDLEAKGLSINYKLNPETGNSNLKIRFSESFITKLTGEEGDYDFVIAAQDRNGKSRTATLTISASDAVLKTLGVIESDVWSSKAVLRGTLLKETTEELFFQYRKAGQSDWMQVNAVRDNQSISAAVSSLEPNTMYEYRAVAGEKASSVIGKFTTDNTTQLPNNGFEYWSKPGKAWLIYGDGQEMFWDSGNHGSATMNKNVTNYDASIKQSGAYSIKLQSQFVGVGTIGKFAAGNVFAGKYLGTDGTDGILGFGRRFTSRPKKLRGYYKYNSGQIDYSSLTNSNSSPYAPKGVPDTAHVYVALGDWVPENYNNEEVAVLIKTKSSERKLFDPQDPAIIAFGQMQSGVSTEGDNLHPFEIDLDYRSLQRIPKFIVVVASASKYGDYFTGSSSSVLWLDDLELIYE